MLVDVTACGHEGTWQFPGSRAFAAWARNRPWCAEGGLCVLRTADSQSHEQLFASIRRTLYGLHGDGRQLDFRLLACAPDSGGPLRAIQAALDIHAPAQGFIAARDDIRTKLLDRHIVFVLHEQKPLPSKEWDRFVQQMEDCRKAKEPVGLCVVVLDTRSIVQAQPVCDFASGQLMHQVLDLTEGISKSSLWQVYLHQRACWDAGGSLRQTSMLSERLSRSTLGDDQQVEAMLQDHAVEAMAQTQKIDLLDLYLKGELDNGRVSDELKAHYLLWRPPRTHGWSIVPWAARALLARGRADHHVWTLRHSLVCAPLASEILSACMQVEARIRTALHGKGKMEMPDEKTQNSFQDFIDGVSFATIYPTGHPSRPVLAQDVWAFCTLGETLRLAGWINKEEFQACQNLKELRNSTAHGHYVCWAHIEQVVKAMRHFAR